MWIRISGVAVAALLGVIACGGSDDSSGGGGKGGNAGSGASSTGGSSGNGGSAGSGNGGTTSGGGSGGSGGGFGGSGGTGGAPPVVCNDECHFIRAGANGTGADWDDALPELPGTLVRGHVYFFAAGDYAAHDFDDAADAGQTIRVLRATATDHGTETGWQTAYGEGQATFGPLSITSPDFELDGKTQTRVVGEFQGNVVDIDADAVTVRGIDMDGNFAMTGGAHTQGACSVMNVHGDNVVIEGNLMHDAADDGVAIGGSDGVKFNGNRVYALHGCGTDGGCGPCYNGHSDGLEIYDLTNSEFVGNMAYDIASTSTFFFGNWADELGDGPNEYCENILIANNILYSPDTGFVIYIEDSVGVRLFNNTIWGQKQGAYGGLSVGENVSNLDIVNNVILSINYAHIGGSYDAAEHHGDFNFFGSSLGQWQDAANDIVGSDPGFTGIPDQSGSKVDNPTPEMFAPESGSPILDKGTGTGTYAIPANDFFGKPRDATPNIGAIE